MKALTLLLTALVLSLPLTAAAGPLRLPPQVVQQLHAAQTALADDDLPQAEVRLEALLTHTLKDAARALALQLAAHLALRQENQPLALTRLQQAHGLNALPAADQRRLLRSIAQLQFARQQWREGIDSLNGWLEQANADPEATVTAADYRLLAQAEGQLERWHRVLDAAGRALELDPPPDEGLDRLRLSAHFALEQWPQATELLNQLVQRQPANADYWQQLTQLYQHQELNAEALATLRAAFLRGVLTEPRHRRWLARLMLQQGLPQRASEVLAPLPPDEQTLELQAQAQLQARHYRDARATLRALVEQRPTFTRWRQLAYLQAQLQEWSAVESSLAQALKHKPGPVAELALLRGMAATHQGRYTQAREHFEQALRDAGHRDRAESWLQYLQRLERAG